MNNEGNNVSVSEINMTGMLVRCNRGRSSIRKTYDSVILPTW